MSEPFLRYLLWFAAIGCALIAGLYFAFSTFIMTALGRLEQEPGILAMNAINSTILQSLFMPLFFGTTVASLLLSILGLLRMERPGAMAMLVGGVIYLVGMFVCTAACNVPLNNQLASVDASTAEAASVWARFLKEWTMWNHVRTVSSTAAAALYMAAIAAK